MTHSDLRSFNTFADHIAEQFGIDVDSLSADAENVLRRNFLAGIDQEFDTFIGQDGRLYIRWES